MTKYLNVVLLKQPTICFTIVSPIYPTNTQKVDYMYITKDYSNPSDSTSSKALVNQGLYLYS